MSGVGGEPEPEPPPPVVVQRGVSGRRRYRVIEDPERLCEELKSEELAVEKAKKKLKILVQKRDEAFLAGSLYKPLDTQIAKVERQLDKRLKRVEELVMLIQIGMDAISDDDEEVLLLS